MGYQYSLQREIKTTTFYEPRWALSFSVRNPVKAEAEEAWGEIMTNYIVLLIATYAVVLSVALICEEDTQIQCTTLSWRLSACVVLMAEEKE